MKSDNAKSPNRATAVTLLELLVVVIIVGILATIATGVYTNQTRRARIAATIDLINQLQIGIVRYEVDLGSYPPSGSSTLYPPGDLTGGDTSNRRDGSGVLHLALMHSMSGNAYTPASRLWHGPYINVQAENLAATIGGNVPGNTDFLDSWGGAIIYVVSPDYGTPGTGFTGGTQVFSAPVADANPALPAPNPYLARGETYYNPGTYQIISYGPDGLTLPDPAFKGAAGDDLTNFGY
jgi:prepilin-type N-terminal cleavage/methylation domain-containing protein